MIRGSRLIPLTHIYRYLVSLPGVLTLPVTLGSLTRTEAQNHRPADHISH
jgi:hypothetical protein